MIKGYVESIESLGLVDGPGIRSVVFLGGCKLRCKYCQNPETWKLKEPNMTPMELAQKLLRNKPYFKRNNGGVTFSGGEPLLQSKFIIEVAKILKQENIHIALDTAGVGLGDYDELLRYIDLVLFDVKHTDAKEYKELTGLEQSESLKFIDAMNKNECKVWIRQVIVPDLMDNENYLKDLATFLKKINNIERINFLPYHKLGDEKYEKLGINNPYKDKIAMDKDKCEQLYQKFLEIYDKEKA
ncbi:MAG: pyruvate formate lyase-activating protein [Bacilli bacterium]|jgi:pyruvate formate lyase activating enzyme|nr:pyruvate formate lyase-activating protein [Bacilli bacterium]